MNWPAWIEWLWGSAPPLEASGVEDDPGLLWEDLEINVDPAALEATLEEER